MKKFCFLAALMFGLTFGASAGLTDTVVKTWLTKSAPQTSGCSIFDSVLLWLPNRTLDLFDIFSVGFGLQCGVKAEARVTRALDFSMSDGFGSCMVRWDYNRHLGITNEQGHHLNFLYFGSEKYDVDETIPFPLWDFPLSREWTKGTAKLHHYEYDWWVSPFSSDYDIKTGSRDWWEIAAEAGVFGGFRVAVHPIEILDFVCGIFFIDFKDDDIVAE